MNNLCIVSVCMYVFMCYVCMYLCVMYVCMYLCVCVCLWAFLSLFLSLGNQYPRKPGFFYVGPIEEGKGTLWALYLSIHIDISIYICMCMSSLGAPLVVGDPLDLVLLGYLSIYLSIYVHMCLSIDLSMSLNPSFTLCVCVCLSLPLFMHSYVSPSPCVPWIVYLCSHMYLYLYLAIYICMYVCCCDFLCMCICILEVMSLYK